MQKNYIVHLSDFHIRQENIENIKEIRAALVEDIKINCEHGQIAFLVFSGDLVFSGTKENYELALDEFILPMINELDLQENQIIYVPGNHEVDISKVDKDFSQSFNSRILTSGVSANDLTKHNVKDRLSAFFDFIELFFKWPQNELVFSKQINICDTKYGITLVNTAWNTAGDSDYEAKKIIIPRNSFVSAMKLVENCDKKILVMHHPIDWFYDYNAAEIEVLLNKYDFVLTGHKHFENISMQIGMNGTTIYNFASKIDIDGTQNGYSIISFDDSSEVSINNRTYIKRRLVYAPNTNISENGIKTFIMEPNSINQLCCDTLLNTKSGFTKNLESLFIVNLLDNSSKKSFDELFVPPIIGTMSEQTKERFIDADNKFNFELNNIFSDLEDITFWGKKESGKTIFANFIAKYIYENYHCIKKIPIILDCNLIQNYKSAIEKAIISKIHDLMMENKSISNEKITLLLKNGCFVLILDNYDKLNNAEILIKTFKDKFPKNKIIFFRIQNFATLSDEDKEIIQEKLSKNTNNYFIQSMDKHSIRKLAQNVSEINPNIEDGYIDRIIHSFSVNNMPRTPFAVSLILSICNESSNYLPTNQSKIVQAFMEKLLEKLNPEEVLSKTFNFENKERYLASFAYLLFSRKSYNISKNDFLTFTKDYHDKKGYSLRDSKFDKLFFEKGILVEYNNLVFFRFECLNDYYLAKYCQLNKEFLYEDILNKDNYLNYSAVVNYYAGMVLDDCKLINAIKQYIFPYFSNHKDLGDLFEIDSIKLELMIPQDKLRTAIANTKQFSTEEKDKLTDIPDNSENYTPTKYKAKINYDENISFALTVELLGCVLKNSEEIDNTVKQEAFNIYISSCLIIWKQLREMLLNFASEIKSQIINNKENDNTSSKESINKACDCFCDLIKISVPLGVSSFIFECVGTEKMKLIFEDYYNAQSYDSPEKLLLLMLLCDLKISGWSNKLKEYISNTAKKDFLWVVFFKCNYCIKLNYFGDETNKIKDLCVDCYLKVNKIPKQKKSQIKGILNKKIF